MINPVLDTTYPSEDFEFTFVDLLLDFYHLSSRWDHFVYIALVSMPFI